MRTNLPLESVRETLATPTNSVSAVVYCYIVATIEEREGGFIQRGSGPNFQGGAISLCTCKHLMRTFRNLADWPGVWIAGFTGIRAGYGRNALVYLMRVDYAFASHADLWAARSIPTRLKRAKAAETHPYGDIFRPLPGRRDPFDHRRYAEPHAEHVHRLGGGWRDDIDYTGPGGRRAALLIGDPQASYLWNRPMLYLQSRLHRGQTRRELPWLLEHVAP